MHLVTENAADLQATYELDVFGKRGITIVRGSGSRLFDDQGRAYIDCIGGQGAANLGHAHPAVTEAITEQASRLINCPGAFANDVRAVYMRNLVAAAPTGLDRVFLCNSGTESVEAALKFARLSTGKTRVIAARRAFHGRTFGAMSATFNPNYSKGCGPLVPGFSHVPFNEGEALAEAMTAGDVAAVILEPVQGEGGVRPIEATFLARARQLCDQHGAMLILDEVQTGFGRTGSLFACQQFDVKPDLLCLAKSIANGVPMGAVLVNRSVTAPIGRHGTTFGGNPLACAAASAVLRVMHDEQLPERAREHGALLVALLEEQPLPHLREIRHRGLMIGIDLKIKVKPVLSRLAEQGVLALPAGPTVLRLLPPLNTEWGDLARAAALIRETLGQF